MINYLTVIFRLQGVICFSILLIWFNIIMSIDQEQTIDLSVGKISLSELRKQKLKVF